MTPKVAMTSLCKPLVFTAFCLAQAAVAPSQEIQTAQQRAEAVETGLAPPVDLEGMPSPRFHIAAEMARLHVPGVSVAVVHNGRIEWAKGYGTLSAEGRPVTPDTLFQAASLSKSVTASAALLLVQLGKLSLDASVRSELRSWQLPENEVTLSHPVTLRQLLSHTAGINNHGFDGYQVGRPVPTLPEILDGRPPAENDPIKVEDVPGRHYSYSGGGYVVVQQLLVDATRQSFPQFMQSSVLGPLGMRHSTFSQPLPESMRSNVAMPVDTHGTPIIGGPHVYPEMAPAGLWTTPSDFARWILAIQRSLQGSNKVLLSSEMTRTMLTPVQENYGLGVGLQDEHGERSFSHTGGNAGYRTLYFAYERGDAAVVFTSGENGGDIMWEIMRSIAHTYKWPDFQPIVRKTVTISKQAKANYRGVFTARLVKTLTIAQSGDKLTIMLPGDNPRELFAASESDFFTTTADWRIHFDNPNHGVLWLGNEQFLFERE